MNISLCAGIRGSRPALFSLALGLLLAGSVMAQVRPGIRATGWKYPERYELPLMARGQTNRLKGMIMGDHGLHLSNRIYRVTRMQLEHYELEGTTNLIARAPECLFNMEDRIAWSTGRLEIVGLNGAMRIEGNHGFHVQMTNSVLTISNRVRTVIERNTLGRFHP